MKDVIVEVGPGRVRGPCDAPPELVTTALECIDDDIAIFDEQPVAVTAMWREVFRSVLPDRVGTVVLVCPTWWPPPRVDRVREAAATKATSVVALPRVKAFAHDVAGWPTVIEIAHELVAVSRADCVLAAEPRLGDQADIARSVADAVGKTTAALVDAPAGIDGATELANAIAQCLRNDRVPVTIVDPERVLTAVEQPAPQEGALGRGSRAVALSAVVVAVAMLCVGLGIRFGMNGTEATALQMTLLVEGRVAVKVPAQWTTRRITTGPGSARVQVMAPDNRVALLITQSPVRNGETLSATAATLRSALDEQQAGVFDRFNPDDRRADRPAATYRELRDGRQIDWAVFVDDTLRIGIGCQSAPNEEHTVRDVCDEAIQSAHAIV